MSIEFIIAQSAQQVHERGWLGCPSFADPVDAAREWDRVGASMPLRVLDHGRLTFGTHEQVKQVIDAYAEISCDPKDRS